MQRIYHAASRSARFGSFCTRQQDAIAVLPDKKQALAQRVDKARTRRAARVRHVKQSALANCSCNDNNRCSCDHETMSTGTCTLYRCFNHSCRSSFDGMSSYRWNLHCANTSSQPRKQDKSEGEAADADLRAGRDASFEARSDASAAFLPGSTDDTTSA